MSRIPIAIVVIAGMPVGLFILVVGFWPAEQENAHPTAARVDQPLGPDVRPGTALTVQEISQKNAMCLQCHSTAGRVTKLSGGEQLSMYIDVAVLQSSVHGDKLFCLSCHTETMGKASLEAATLRQYAVARSGACKACHQAQAAAYDASSHGKGVAAGSLKAATCTDCHGSHGVQKVGTLVAETNSCALCHGKVAETYSTSVHGRLVAAGRADAADCLDCHTSNKSPHTVQRVDDPDAVTSPKLQAETCGRCHEKPLETYLNTFHGRAMRLGVKDNAATCTDCHGAYGVQRVHGPEAEGAVDTTRMATSCAKCHAGADERFAAGWLGHEEPSPTWFPLVHYAERFFFFLTTSVVAFGILHVELDILRWVANRRKERR